MIGFYILVGYVIFIFILGAIEVFKDWGKKSDYHRTFRPKR